MKNSTIAQVTKLFPEAILRVYKPGQIVIYYGDSPNHIMLVKSGAVKFYDTDSEGNEKVLHINGAGSMFPLFYCLEDSKQVDAFYSALCHTELLLIPINDFTNLLKTTPPYAFEALQRYIKEMSHVVLRLKTFGKSSAKQKLLGVLSYLIEEHSVVSRRGSDWYRVNFPISQQTLADITGLTRETVNAVLRQADKLNIVKTPKQQTLEINKANLEKNLTEVS